MGRPVQPSRPTQTLFRLTGNGHGKLLSFLTAPSPSTEFGFSSVRLDSIYRLEDYVLAADAPLEPSGVSAVVRYAHMQLPVSTLVQTGVDEHDAEYVVSRIVGRAPGSLELEIRSESANPEEVPYLLRDANLVAPEPSTVTSAHAVKSPLLRSVSSSLAPRGILHATRHTFLLVPQGNEATDNIPLTLYHLFKGHNEPLGYFAQVPTAQVRLIEPLLARLGIETNDPVLPTSLLLDTTPEPEVEEIMFRREEGWMEVQQNEGFKEGREYDELDDVEIVGTKQRL